MLFDEVRENFGVRLRNERVSLFLERRAQLFVVFDDAVVHHPHVAITAFVRMRVYLRRFAVSRPTQVRNSAFAVKTGGHFHA